MKRRTAIKRIGLGLSLGYLAPRWLASCDTSPGRNNSNAVPYDGHVVVVGAGLSGLYLANILYSRGIKVTVLEASGRICGRVMSFEPDMPSNRRVGGSFPVELGAEVIYGTDSTLAINLRRANVPTVEVTQMFTNQFALGKQVKSANDWASNADFLAAQAFVSSLPSYRGGAAQSVTDAISGLTAPAQMLINAQVGNFYGASNDRLGVSELAAQLSQRVYNSDALVIRGNFMEKFISSRFFRGNYPVILDAPVKSIDYSNPSAIQIAYGNGEAITATKVVVTVPVSILKEGSIAFSPGLPGEKMAALSKIGMGACLRAILEFKKNFWGTDANIIWGGANTTHCFSAGVGRSDASSPNQPPPNLLSITINGPDAERLAPLGENIIDPILAELDAFYPDPDQQGQGQATRYVRRDEEAGSNQILSATMDWGARPYIKGGYSYPLPGAQPDDYVNLGKPVQDALYFAGEATDTKGYAGTLNGAMNSAERAAQEIIDSIQQ